MVFSGFLVIQTGMLAIILKTTNEICLKVIVEYVLLYTTTKQGKYKGLESLNNSIALKLNALANSSVLLQIAMPWLGVR